MTDNIAILEGYTEEFIAEFPDRDIFILVKPETSFSGRFIAWNMENQEFVEINGQECSIKTG